jgi:hypothetical protein
MKKTGGFLGLLMLLLSFLNLNNGVTLAQDALQHWILIQNEGRVYAAEVVSATVFEVTQNMSIFDKTLIADQPMWSSDGRYLTFLMARQQAARSDGDVVWQTFGQTEYHVMSLCQTAEYKCTFPSMFGDWMVFTSIREADNLSELLAFNVVTGTLSKLQSGGFAPDPDATWKPNGTYLLHGTFGRTTLTEKLFTIPGAAITNATPIPSATPQFAVPTSTPTSGTPIFQSRFDGCDGAYAVQENGTVTAQVVTITRRFNGTLYGKSPWRPCGAAPIALSGG